MNIPEILVANGTGAVLVCFLFLLRVRGEDEMMFDYQHEIDVMKSVIRACGAENSVK